MCLLRFQFGSLPSRPVSRPVSANRKKVSQLASGCSCAVRGVTLWHVTLSHICSTRSTSCIHLSMQNRNTPSYIAFCTVSITSLFWQIFLVTLTSLISPRCNSSGFCCSMILNRSIRWTVKEHLDLRRNLHRSSKLKPPSNVSLSDNGPDCPYSSLDAVSNTGSGVSWLHLLITCLPKHISAGI